MSTRKIRAAMMEVPPQYELVVDELRDVGYSDPETYYDPSDETFYLPFSAEEDAYEYAEFTPDYLEGVLPEGWDNTFFDGTGMQSNNWEPDYSDPYYDTGQWSSDIIPDRWLPIIEEKGDLLVIEYVGA